MIDRVELAAAAFCLVIALYTLLNHAIPIYLLLLVATGIVTGILFLPSWYDHD